MIKWVCVVCLFGCGWSEVWSGIEEKMRRTAKRKGER